jgi:hypothetical protein
LRGGIEFGAALYRAWAGAASWGAAAALLVRLTGRHAAETTVYVRGIKRTYLGLR